MLRPKEECIATRAFASLILDYEYPADELLPAFVSCRVLIEDLYQDTITVETREQAIKQFNNWHK